MAGGHAWQGACMAGRMHDGQCVWQAVCMAGDMHGGGMHDRGHAW